MDSIVETTSNSMAEDFSRSKLSTAGGHGRSESIFVNHCGKFVMVLVHILCLCFLWSSALFIERSA